MFCQNCGAVQENGARFCAKCGSAAPGASQVVGISSQVPTTPVSVDQNVYRNPLPKVAIIVNSILLGIIVLIGIGSAIFGLSSGGSTASTTSTGTTSVVSVGGLAIILLNWFLGIAGLVAVLWLAVGVIMCIIYVVKSSSSNGALKEHYRKLALWNVLSPASLFIFVMVCYIIITVIANSVS